MAKTPRKTPRSDRAGGTGKRASVQSAVPRRSRCLLVLGMHRSGTSAITRVFSLLGADLPKNLMPAAAFNQAGHWESNDLAAIHDKLLASAGSTWHDWRAFNPDWFQSEA